MKKFLFLLLTAMILFSGCVGQKTVKIGDTVSVDYTGRLEDGEIFDTSIESVAKENNMFTHDRKYEPLQFTVGNRSVIPGFDEGVVGMKVGESKTLTISPEDGYGPVNPALIQASPIIMVIPNTFPRVLDIPLFEFERTFGPNHIVGDIVTIPNTDINMTLLNMTSNVSLSYNFKVGDTFPAGTPWNQTITKIDDKNITVEHSLKKNEIVQFPNVPWNSTLIDINAENVTFQHNAIPDTEIQTFFGPVLISFNETSIIIDRNHKLAGKTLIFNVTLKSIDQ